MLGYVEPGDIIIGHSNGCAIAYDLMRAGAPVAGMVFINAAVEATIVRESPCKWIDVYYNAGDQITEAAALAQRIGIVDTCWGEMGHVGYRGPDPAITNFNCGGTVGMPIVSGHSDFFTAPKISQWGPFLAARVKAKISP